MSDPLRYGDPIDPNEQYLAPPAWVEPSVQPVQLWVAESTGPTVPTPPAPWQNSYYRAPDERPSQAVVAAVLCLVTASLLLITGFVVIFAALTVDPGDVDPSDQTSLFAVISLMNLVAAALLIFGGVLLLARIGGARAAITAGTVLCIAIGGFWLADSQVDAAGLTVGLLVFCGPTVIATVLSLNAKVTQWLEGTPAG